MAAPEAVFVILTLIKDRFGTHIEERAWRCRVSVDEIINKLDERKQRATYGAVAGVVGGVLPRSLMTGRQKNHKNSWVVAGTGADRGWPTGYEHDQIHPDCLHQASQGFNNVISESTTLKQWFESLVDRNKAGFTLRGLFGRRES